MIRLSESIDVPRSRHEVFAYLSDFTTTKEWDPGTVDATRIDAGPIRVGSQFEVVARFRGKESTLRYVVSDLDAGERIVLRGENQRLVSVDTIEAVEAAADATRVTYVAEFTFKGIARLAEPFLRSSMIQLGEDAVEGLRGRLGGVIVR